MEIADHIEHLRAEGLLLADAAETTGLDPAVPTCPGWTVRDVVRHMGEVFRWARSHVAESRQEINKDSFADYPSDDLLLAWYREGHALILAALEAADPDGDYYAFLPGPRGTRFWARRQAHETTIHRVDAQSVTGQLTPVAADFAADGIDELFRGFYARRPTRLTSTPPVSVALVATDADHAWTLTIGEQGASAVDGVAPADCTVRGATSGLYMLLWNRIGLDSLDVTGTPAALELWREKARVRWS